MSRRKYLSFKSPNKMKLIGLTYLVAFFIFAPVRYHTGEAFKMTGEFIQRTTRWHLIMKHSNNDNTNIDMLTNTVETEYYEIELDKFIQLEGIAAMMEVTVDYLLEEFCVDGELNLEDVPWEDNNN